MNAQISRRIIGCIGMCCAIVLLTSNSLVYAQQRFPVQGEIEFEKRVNMHAFFRASISQNKDAAEWIERAFNDYKSKNPQFKTLKSILKFSNSQTLFSPLKDESGQNSNFIFSMPGIEQINTVQMDLATKTALTKKTVFEEEFLVKDSLRKITWKITDETREIAGYPCRRANALIMDSIYVVAFYTDKIPVSGGPESFSGLPGMILGLALPHDHITWFATKVTDVAVPVKATQMDIKKGKVIDKAEFTATLDKIFQRFGERAKPYLRFLYL